MSFMCTLNFIKITIEDENFMIVYKFRLLKSWWVQSKDELTFYCSFATTRQYFSTPVHIHKLVLVHVVDPAVLPLYAT